MKAYRLMDPETHQIFVEKDVHFEESSPSLSSNPLHTSYHVETYSDTNDSASTDSNTWGSIDNCSKKSQHYSNPHAYIAIVKGPSQQGTFCLPPPTSVDDFLADIAGLFVESHIADLGENIDDFYLLFDEDDPSTIFVRAHYNPHVHSSHDQSSQVGVIVDTYVQ